MDLPICLTVLLLVLKIDNAQQCSGQKQQLEPVVSKKRLQALENPDEDVFEDAAPSGGSDKDGSWTGDAFSDSEPASEEALGLNHPKTIYAYPGSFRLARLVGDDASTGVTETASNSTRNKARYLRIGSANESPLSKDQLKMNCLGLPIFVSETTMTVPLASRTVPKDVKFLFASTNHSEYRMLHSDGISELTQIDFDINRDTVVIVHGFMSSGKEKWLLEMGNAFMRRANVNVIIVDWQKGSNTWNYVAAAANVRLVGTEIAKLLDRLKMLSSRVGNYGKRGRIHLVGHSLGSHIMGFVAKNLKDRQSGKSDPWLVKRITALDPAQPCFQEKTNSMLRLTKDDAPFIDVIHTNGRNVLQLGLGLPEPVGHMDFYPNGGQIQLGCSKIESDNWSFLSIPVRSSRHLIPAIQETICSHGRSHELFTASLLNSVSGVCGFIGKPWNRSYENLDDLLKPACDGECPEMGIDSEKSFPRVTGTFFVTTSDTPPYCSVNEATRKEILHQLIEDKNAKPRVLSKVASFLLKQ